MKHSTVQNLLENASEETLECLATEMQGIQGTKALMDRYVDDPLDSDEVQDAEEIFSSFVGLLRAEAKRRRGQPQAILLRAIDGDRFYYAENAWTPNKDRAAQYPSRNWVYRKFLGKIALDLSEEECEARLKGSLLVETEPYYY